MNNTDQKPINTYGGGRPSVEATLNYIDKVCAELDRTGSASNRVSVITLIVSLLQLLVAAGWVSTQGDITLFGLGIKASFVILLASSMLIVACLVVYNRNLTLRGYTLYTEILRLYEVIGFVTQHDAMKDTLTSPFRSRLYSRVVIAPVDSDYHEPQNSLERVYEAYISRAVRFVIRYVPTLAEVATTLKLGQIIGWEHPWLWVPFFAFAGITYITTWVDNYSRGYLHR